MGSEIQKIYSPETIVWHYEKVVGLYRSFLTGRKNESEAKELINSIQKEYEKDIEIFRGASEYFEA